MPEVERIVRRSYRDDYDSDDDGRSSISHSRHGGDGSYRTVQRYRVTPSRVEDVEIDRRSRVDIIPRNDRIEIDRRSERIERFEPERPRSSVDIRPARSTVVERYVEREPIREPERERERTRTVVYERDRREPEPLRPWERAPNRPWEAERETDVTISRTTERRDEPYELERYQREVEYYDRPEPAPQPIIIRQRAPEPQQIIVQEAPQPPPATIVLPPAPQPPREEVQVVRREEIKEVIRPEPRRQEDEYYYRRDTREVGPARRSDEEFALERREIRPRDSVSDGDYSDEDYVVRKRIIRERSRSSSPHHRRHIAEGALAGAGAAAILASHRNKTGDGGGHRGRKVVGGAALGALGAEVLTRARSRYREYDDDRRSRSRSSSRHSHRKIKTAIGLAAAGLAAAAAAKYVSNRRADKEELGRGRSRTRSVSRRRYHSADSYSDYERTTRTSRSRSKHADPKHRASTIAKAGAGTAIVAGVVEHLRNKSRRRSGERSKSRIRTGAEIAGAGLAGAAVAGLYENRKAKEDERETEEDSRRERRRSRSRARSVGAYSDPGVDPELGQMVQYGTEPVYTHQTQTTTYRGYDNDPALAGGAAGAAYGATRGSRSRSHRRRHSSSSSDDRRRSRSRSRVRDIAGAAAGTAAAAIGINQYKKRKEKKEMERERERRRYEEEPAPENYYARNYQDDRYTPSPPHASGGSYYPESTSFAPPPQAAPGFTHHTTTSTTHVHETIPPYNPADYAGQPPTTHDPYYPPRGDNVSSTNAPRLNVPPAMMSGAMPYFPPPPTAPLQDEQLHHSNQARDLERAEEGRLNNVSPSPPDSPRSKSVNFAPLSPTSSRRLSRIHKTARDNGSSTHLHESESDSDANLSVTKYTPPTTPPDESPYETTSRRRRRRRRRNSDPSSDRPTETRKHRRRHHNASRSPSPYSSDEIEVLPDRFDADGRPLDRHGNPFRSRGSGENQGQEMVEKFAGQIGDVIEGKKTWKDLLRGFVEEAGSNEGSERSGSSSRRRRE